MFAFSESTLLIPPGGMPTPCILGGGSNVRYTGGTCFAPFGTPHLRYHPKPRKAAHSPPHAPQVRHVRPRSLPSQVMRRGAGRAASASRAGAPVRCRRAASAPPASEPRCSQLCCCSPASSASSTSTVLVSASSSSMLQRALHGLARRCGVGAPHRLRRHPSHAARCSAAAQPAHRACRRLRRHLVSAPSFSTLQWLKLQPASVQLYGACVLEVCAVDTACLSVNHYNFLYNHHPLRLGADVVLSGCLTPGAGLHAGTDHTHGRFAP